MGLMLGLSGCYFLVAGIQYWCPFYLEQVLMAPKAAAISLYTIVTISAPLLGVILGGSLTTYLGGYNSVESQKVI